MDYGIKREIKTLANKEKMSIHEIASICGVSDSLVEKWENGEVAPNIEQALILAKVYQISVDVLLYGEIKTKHNWINVILAGVTMLLCVSIGFFISTLNQNKTAVKQDSSSKELNEYCVVDDFDEGNIGSFHSHEKNKTASISELLYQKGKETTRFKMNLNHDEPVKVYVSSEDEKENCSFNVKENSNFAFEVKNQTLADNDRIYVTVVTPDDRAKYALFTDESSFENAFIVTDDQSDELIKFRKQHDVEDFTDGISVKLREYQKADIATLRNLQIRVKHDKLQMRFDFNADKKFTLSIFDPTDGNHIKYVKDNIDINEGTGFLEFPVELIDEIEAITIRFIDEKTDEDSFYVMDANELIEAVEKSYESIK